MAKTYIFQPVILSWYIRTSTSMLAFLGSYPNFVYAPIFEGGNEPIRISSDVNQLDAMLAL